MNENRRRAPCASRDSVKAAAAVLCLVNAALLAILLMSAFDLGGVNESAGILFDSLLAGL